jgi:hypothetical protein
MPPQIQWETVNTSAGSRQMKGSFTVNETIFALPHAFRALPFLGHHCSWYPNGEL